MLARIPSRLLSEWMAFDLIEPFGERRADLRAAQIVTAIANVNRDVKAHKEPYTIEEFVLRFDGGPHPASPAEAGEERKQTWQEQKARLMAMFPPPPP